METKRYMAKADMIITPIVEITLLVISVGVASAVCRYLGFSLFLFIISGYLTLMTITLLAAAMIRRWAPFRPGIYRFSDQSKTLYAFNLEHFLRFVNLTLVHGTGFIPPILRKGYYQLLGGHFGPGIIPIGGRIADPSLTIVEENVMIGDEALVLAHAVVSQPENMLIMAKVHIKKGALIGARAMIMPGVTIGENAMIPAGVTVPMNTIVPPNEVWTGVKPGDPVQTYSQSREGF